MTVRPTGARFLLAVPQVALLTVQAATVAPVHGHIPARQPVVLHIVRVGMTNGMRAYPFRRSPVAAPAHRPSGHVVGRGVVDPTVPVRASGWRVNVGKYPVGEPGQPRAVTGFGRATAVVDSQSCLLMIVETGAYARPLTLHSGSAVLGVSMSCLHGLVREPQIALHLKPRLVHQSVCPVRREILRPNLGDLRPEQ